MLRERGYLGEWVAGWVSVTRRYCIKTAKPILKLFRPSGSPIILVSSDPCADTQFQGEPLQRGVKYTGWEKLAIFDGNRPLSGKRCEIGRWLLWNVNRKSWVPDWMVSFSMTLFSRSRHFWSRISQKRCISETKLLKNTNRKPYTVCQMIPLSMTLSDLWPGL